jgi:23S rRNA pseudouridine2605 synthase
MLRANALRYTSRVTTMRINQALARAGAASRRGAEELVLAGRVKLNGKVVRELAAQVDPQRDRLELDGKPLRLTADTVYYLYHKPRGLISTLKDEKGRPGLEEVCGKLPGHPRPVGRLDRASEGLMLLTSDGEVANRLTHPRYGVRKEYQVTVEPRLRDGDARKMVAGVELEDGVARFEGIELQEDEAARTRVLITVSEGRNRLIRRVCELLGYEVKRLKRVRLGPLTLGKLELNATRTLNAEELGQLLRVLGIEPPPPRGRRG